jgi:hypothetical protein
MTGKTDKLLTARDQMRRRTELKEAKRKKIQIAINAATEDANVLILLQWLRDESGFWDIPTVRNQTGISVEATLHNAGRESIYHDLRRLMSAETRNIVEKTEDENAGTDNA